MTTQTARKFQMGDTVSVSYHGATVVGVISQWCGSGVSLDFATPQWVGCRTEAKGVWMRWDAFRETATLVAAGSAKVETDESGLTYAVRA